MGSPSVFPQLLLLALIIQVALCASTDPHSKYNGEPNERGGADGSSESESSESSKSIDVDHGNHNANHNDNDCLISCYCNNDRDSQCALTSPMAPQSPPPASRAPAQHQRHKNSHVGTAVAGAAIAGAAGVAAVAHQSRKRYPSPPPSAPPANQPYQQPKPKEERQAKCNWCIRPNCNPGACQATPNFNAKADAEKIYKAVTGIGTDEDTLIKILINRSEEQLEEIRKEYQGLGSGLDYDIENDTSMKIKELFMALLQSRADFFADELKRAFDDLDDEAMIMILTSVSPCAIREIGSAFSKKNENKPLVHAAEGASKMKFEKFLVELIKANRDKEGTVDIARAKNDAQNLIKGGPDSWFTDKGAFIDIFTHRSFSHIRQVKEEYNKLRPKPGFNKDLVEHSGGGKLTKGLEVMLRNIEDQPGYFADEIEGSVEKLIGMGIKDNKALVRILRGRCGIDLGDIRDAYPKNHDGKSLVKKLENKAFGDYEDALVQICTQQKL